MRGAGALEEVSPAQHAFELSKSVLPWLWIIVAYSLIGDQGSLRLTLRKTVGVISSWPDFGSKRFHLNAAMSGMAFQCVLMPKMPLMTRSSGKLVFPIPSSSRPSSARIVGKKSNEGRISKLCEKKVVYCVPLSVCRSHKVRIRRNGMHHTTHIKIFFEDKQTSHKCPPGRTAAILYGYPRRLPWCKMRLVSQKRSR